MGQNNGAIRQVLIGAVVAILSSVVTGSMVYAHTATGLIAKLDTQVQVQQKMLETMREMQAKDTQVLKDADLMTNNRLDRVASVIEKTLEVSNRLIDRLDVQLQRGPQKQ